MFYDSEADAYNWRYEPYKDHHDTFNLHDTRSIKSYGQKSQDSYWDRIQDDISVQSFNTARVRSPSPDVAVRAASPEAYYYCRGFNDHPRFYEDFDKTSSNIYTDQKPSQTRYENRYFGCYSPYQRASSPNRNYLKDDTAVLKKHRQRDENFMQYNFDKRPKIPKHPPIDPLILKQERDEWYARDRALKEPLSRFPYNPYTKEEWTTFSHELQKNPIFLECFKERRPKRVFTLKKITPVFQPIQRVIDEVTSYMQNLFITPFTHNKEGDAAASNGGAGYTVAKNASGEAPAQQNIPGRSRRRNSMSEADLDVRNANRELSSEHNQDITGDRWLSTFHVDAFLEAAIQNHPNARHVALLPSTVFEPRNSTTASSIRKNIRNWRRDETTVVLIPYCRNSHHRMCVYERFPNSTAPNILSHYDPYGPPQILQTTRIPEDVRRIIQQKLNAIDGADVEGRIPPSVIWQEPDIPVIVRQPLGNGTDCGIISTDIGLMAIDNKRPTDVQQYDVAGSRTDYNDALGQMLREEIVPSFNNHSWTYFPDNSPPTSQDARDIHVQLQPSDIEVFSRLYKAEPITSDSIPIEQIGFLTKGIMLQHPEATNVAMLKPTSFWNDQIKDDDFLNRNPKNRFIQIPYQVPNNTLERNGRKDIASFVYDRQNNTLNHFHFFPGPFQPSVESVEQCKKKLGPYFPNMPDEVLSSNVPANVLNNLSSTCNAGLQQLALLQHIQNNNNLDLPEDFCNISTVTENVKTLANAIMSFPIFHEASEPPSINVPRQEPIVQTPRIPSPTPVDPSNAYLMDIIQNYKNLPITPEGPIPVKYLDSFLTALVAANGENKYGYLLPSAFNLDVKQINLNHCVSFNPATTKTFFMPFVINSKKSGIFKIDCRQKKWAYISNKHEEISVSALEKMQQIYERISGDIIDLDDPTAELKSYVLPEIFNETKNKNYDPCPFIAAFLECKAHNKFYTDLTEFDATLVKTRLDLFFTETAKRQNFPLKALKSDAWLCQSKEVTPFSQPTADDIPIPAAVSNNSKWDALDVDVKLAYQAENSGQLVESIRQMRAILNNRNIRINTWFSEEELDYFYIFLRESLIGSPYAYFKMSYVHASDTIKDGLLNYIDDYSTHVWFGSCDNGHFRLYLYDIKTTDLFYIDPFGNDLYRTNQQIEQSIRLCIWDIFGDFPNATVSYPRLHPSFVQPGRDGATCGPRIMAYIEYVSKGYDITASPFNIMAYQQRMFTVFDEILHTNGVPMNILNELPNLYDPAPIVQTPRIPNMPQPSVAPIFAPKFAPNAAARNRDVFVAPEPISNRAPVPIVPVIPVPPQYDPKTGALPAAAPQNLPPTNNAAPATVKNPYKGLQSIMSVFPDLKTSVIPAVQPLQPVIDNQMDTSSPPHSPPIIVLDDDISILRTPTKNPETPRPKTAEELKAEFKAKNASSQRKRRAKFSGNTPDGETPEPPRKTSRILNDDTPFIRRKPQPNRTPFTFLNLANLPVSIAQEQFKDAIELFKSTESFSKAILSIFQLSDVLLKLKNDPITNFINVIPPELKEKWKKENYERKNFIIETWTNQTKGWLDSNMNEILNLINDRQGIIDQIEQFSQLHEHDEGITTLGFLYDALHGTTTEITGELLLKYINQITTWISNVKKVEQAMWKAFIPLKDKLSILLREKVVGDRGSYDYFNRVILGFSFHSIPRNSKTENAQPINELFPEIYKEFMHRDETLDAYTFIHKGENTTAMNMAISTFPWTYKFTPMVIDSSENSQDLLQFISQKTADGDMEDDLKLQLAEQNNINVEGANAKEKIEQYYNGTRGMLCTKNCPKVPPELGKQIYDALRRITQSNINDIVPVMAKFEQTFMPVILHHSDCFQGLRTIIRKVREIRHLIGVIDQCKKCMAQCNYKILAGMGTFQLVPLKQRRLLYIENLPPNPEQTEPSTVQRYQRLIQAFDELDSDLHIHTCQCCHRLTATSQFNIIYENDPIIQNMRHILLEPPNTDDQCRNYFGICYYCRKYMLCKRVPLFSVFNGYAYEPLPPALQGLNELEWALIKKVRPLISFTRLTPMAGPARNGIYAFKGTMVHIPNPLEENVSYIVATLPSAQNLVINVQWAPDRPNSKIVNLERMVLAIEWLRRHNPHYADVLIDRSFRFTHANVYFEKDSTSQQLANLIELENADERPTLELVTHYAETDRSNAAPGTALQRYVMKQMNQKNACKWDEKDLDVKCFPELFPTGKYGMHWPRHTTTREADNITARLRHFTGAFSGNRQLLAFYNSHKQMKALFGDVTIQFREMRHRIEGSDLLKSLQGPEKNFDPLVNSVTTTPFKSLPNSYDHTMDMRQKLFTMVDYFGPFNNFLTFNPNEWDWIYLERTYRAIYGLAPTDHYDVNAMVNRNPAVMASYFHNRLLKFLRKVLLVADGPLGELIHDFRHYEWQGRGQTHGHMAVWSKNPIFFDGTNEEAVIKRIDETITCRKPNPVTEPTLAHLVETYQTHRCVTQSCCKPRKRKKAILQECRYGFPHPPADVTILNQEDGEWKFEIGKTNREYQLRRKDDEININAYNAAMLMAWKGNMDIQMCCSKSVSKICYYMTTYLTKQDEAKQNQKEFSKILAEGMQIGPVVQIGLKFLASKLTGAVEQAHYLLQLPTYQASSSCKFLVCDPPEKRRFAVNNLPFDKLTIENLYRKTLVGHHYPGRDKRLAGCSLFNMFTMFQPRTSRKDPITIANTEAAIAAANSTTFNFDPESDDEELLGLNDDGADIEADPDLLSFYGDLPNVTPHHHKMLMKFGGNAFYKSKYGVFLQHSPVFCHYQWKHGSTFASGTPGTVFVLLCKPILARFYIPLITNMDVETIEEFYHRLCLLFKPWMHESEIAPLNGSYQNLWNDYMDFVKRECPAAIEDFNRIIYAKHSRIEKQIEEATLLRMHELEKEMEVDIDPFEQEFEKIAEKFRMKKIDPQELEARIKSLNAEQRGAYDEIMAAVEDQLRHEKNPLSEPPPQILRYISGVAGTGKSHLIKTLHDSITSLYMKIQAEKGIDLSKEEYMYPPVILSAPTAFAAKNIEGITVHSTFGIGREQGGHTPMSKASAARIKVKFSACQLIVIDEVSMVGNSLLTRVHLRCQEIAGNESRPFGGYNVVLLGDLCQLPPVLDSQVFLPITEGQADRLFNNSGVGLNLWREFGYTELTQIMRQKDDLEFAELLNRFRIGVSTRQDFEIIKSRLIKAARTGVCSPQQQADAFVKLLESDPLAIALFPNKVNTTAFNTAVMRHKQMRTFDILADDSDAKGKSTKNISRPWQSKSKYPKNYNAISKAEEQKKLELALADEMSKVPEEKCDPLSDPIGAAMDMDFELENANQADVNLVTVNEPGSNAGMPEFSTGNADDYDLKTLKKQLGSKLAPLAEMLRLAIGARVMLLTNIDQSKGLLNGATGYLRDVFGKEVLCKNDTVGFYAEILVIEFDHDPGKLHEIKRENAVYNAYKKTGATEKITRSQFPIQVAFGTTIHKAQGRSCDNALICLKDCFAKGQAYVALSRVKNLNGLHIVSWASRCAMPNTEAILEYNRLRALNGVGPLPSPNPNDLPQNFDFATVPPAPVVPPQPVLPGSPSAVSPVVSQPPTVPPKPVDARNAELDRSRMGITPQLTGGALLRLSLRKGDLNLTSTNAVLQVLRVIPELLHWIQTHGADNDTLIALMEIYSSLGTLRTADASPVRALIPDFNPTEEFDPMILMTLIFNILDEDILKHFSFTTSDIFTCENCGKVTHRKVKSRNFLDIPLPHTVSKITINNCLAALNDFSCEYNCKSCQHSCLHNIKRQFAFPALPNNAPRYLIAVFERFHENGFVNNILIGEHRSTEQKILGKTWSVIAAIQKPGATVRQADYIPFLKDPELNQYLAIRSESDAHPTKTLPNNLANMYIVIYKEVQKRKHR